MKVVDDRTAKVRCLVKIKIKPNKPLVVLNGSLRISENYPVRIRNNDSWLEQRFEIINAPPHRAKFSWFHASELSEKRENNSSNIVYAFLLDSCHIAVVNDVEFVTWGHCLEETNLENPYYGT